MMFQQFAEFYGYLVKAWALLRDLRVSQPLDRWFFVVCEKLDNMKGMGRSSPVSGEQALSLLSKEV